MTFAPSAGKGAKMPQESTETTVARLDERVKSILALQQQMADDHRSMAESYSELVKGMQRLSLIDAEIASVKDGQKVIWKKLDAYEEERKKHAQTWLWEIGKFALMLLGALLMFKLGLK